MLDTYKVKKRRVSVDKTAKILGVSTQFVRVGIRRKTLPIGVAVKVGQRWNYHISPKLLQEYIGRIDEDDKE